jgi:hypothetical protein
MVKIHPVITDELAEVFTSQNTNSDPSTSTSAIRTAERAVNQLNEKTRNLNFGGKVHYRVRVHNLQENLRILVTEESGIISTLLGC